MDPIKLNQDLYCGFVGDPPFTDDELGNVSLPDYSEYAADMLGVTVEEYHQLCDEAEARRGEYIPPVSDEYVRSLMPTLFSDKVIQRFMECHDLKKLTEPTE